MSGKVTGIEADAASRAGSAIIVGDERGLRRLAELLAPYMPAPAHPGARPVAVLARGGGVRGHDAGALHKAMAAREVHFEQDVPGGKAWFKRADIDAWRRGERPARR